MRGVVLAAALAALAPFGSAANAQGMDPDAMLAQMQAAQAQAQAAARRPGDESLTCEQLQAEFTATMNDPQFRAAMAQSGAWAQARQQQMQDMRGQAMAMAGAGIATGIASAFVPGLGMASSMAMQAQAGAMQRQALANQAEMVAQAGHAQAMAPAAYRGQRLYELAQAKQCAFLNEAGAPQN